MPTGQRRTHLLALLQAVSAVCTSCWPHLVQDMALQKLLREALLTEFAPASDPSPSSGATPKQQTTGQSSKTTPSVDGSNLGCPSFSCFSRRGGADGDASLVLLLKTAMESRFLAVFLQQQKEMEVLTAVATLKVRLAALAGLHRGHSGVSGACRMVKQLLSPAASAGAHRIRGGVNRTDEQDGGTGREAKNAGRVAPRGGLALLRSLLLLVANNVDGCGQAEAPRASTGDAGSRAERAKAHQDERIKTCQTQCPEAVPNTFAGKAPGDRLAVTASATAVLSEVLAHLVTYSQTHDVHAKRDALLLLKQLVDVSPVSWLLQSNVGDHAEGPAPERKDDLPSGSASEPNAISRSPSELPSFLSLPSDYRPSTSSVSPCPINTLIEVSLSHWQHPQRSVSQVARSLWEALSQVTISTSGKHGSCSPPACIPVSHGQRKGNGVCCLPHRLALAVLDLSAVHRKAQNLALLSLLPAVGVEWLLRQRPRLVEQLLMEIGDSFHTGASAVKFLDGIMKHLCRRPSPTGKRLAAETVVAGVGTGRAEVSEQTIASSKQGHHKDAKVPSRAERATCGSAGASPVPVALRQVLYPLLVDALLSLPFGSTKALMLSRKEVGNESLSFSFACPELASLNSWPMDAAPLAVPVSPASRRRLSPDASQRVAGTVFPLLQTLDPQGLASILQLLYWTGCTYGRAASEMKLHPEDCQRAASLLGFGLSDKLESLPMKHASGSRQPQATKEHSNHSRRGQLKTGANQMPWSIGEAVLLLVARQAGVAEWNDREHRRHIGLDHEECVTNSMSGAHENPEADACMADLRQTMAAPQVGARAQTTPQNASCCLVVSGVDIEGSGISVHISSERLQHGLQSGDDDVRMALLKVVAFSRLSSVPPARIELELLLDVLEHGSGRQASGATKAAFADAFKRFLQRARDAYRKQLIERTPEELRLLLKGPSACSGEASRQSPGQPNSRGAPSSESAYSLDNIERKDDKLRGSEQACATIENVSEPTTVGATADVRKRQEDDSLREFLVFLRRLHRAALLQSLPCMHPDRQNTGTTILLFLYTLWGFQPPSDLRKGSSCANAALSAARGAREASHAREKGRLEAGKKLAKEVGHACAASETFAGGCAVAETLGFYAAPVQAQLLGMLASRWPRQSEAARKILKLFPENQLEWGVSSLVLSPRKLQGGSGRDLFPSEAKMEQQQLRPTRDTLEAIFGSGAQQDGRASKALVPCLRSSFMDVLVLIHSIRESDYSAGASQLELALFAAAFVAPLKRMVATRNPSLRTPPRSSGSLERDWKRPRQTEQLASSRTGLRHSNSQGPEESIPSGNPEQVPLSADILIHVLSHALLQREQTEGVLGEAQQEGPANGANRLVHRLFRLLHVFLAASQQRLNALEGHARLSANTPHACIHGLLIVLTKLFRELPSLQSLIHASTGLAEERKHGMVLPTKIGSCEGESGPVENATTRMWGAWRTLVTGLLRLLMDTCSSMFCVIAEGSDSVMLNAVWQQSGQQDSNQKETPSEKQNFNVDCRGHPLLARRPAGGAWNIELTNGEAEDEEETAETLLAVRGWVTVKAAAACLSALLDWVPLEEAEEQTGTTVPSDREHETERRALIETNSKRIPQKELDRGFSHSDKAAAPATKGNFDTSAFGSLQTLRNANVIVTVAEMNAIGRRLLHFLLCCRHLGAMNSLFDTLAGVSRRLLCSAHRGMQALPRTWVHSLLLLLLPQSLAGSPLETSRSALPSGMSVETPSSSTQKSASAPIASESDDVCAASLPPPLRKSASLGLAFVAVLAGEAASADSTVRGGDRCPLLQHTMSILLPLAEGHFDSFFPSIEEAYAHRAHCLNVVRAVNRSGALSSSIACVSLLPPQEAIAALKITQGTPNSHEAQMTGGGSSTDRGSTAADKATEKAAQEKAMETGNEVKSDDPLVGNGAPLPALALAAAVRSSNTTSYFPLRNAATLLLVASVKRLAGKDNDSLHVSTFPLYSFCAGAQQRSLLIPSLAEAQIDLPFLQSADVIPILLRTLEGAADTGHPWQFFVEAVEGERRSQGAVGLQQDDFFNDPLASAVSPTQKNGCIELDGQRDSNSNNARHVGGQIGGGHSHGEVHASGSHDPEADQGALVAVLLLVSRLDFASAVSEGPSLACLLSSVCSVPEGKESKEKGCLPYRSYPQLPFSAGLPTASPVWLLRLLTALRTHLTSPNFHTRLLAARALANYAMQEARLQGPQALLLALEAAAASAMHSQATSNTTCGLLLLSLELLQRPEVADWLEQTVRTPTVLHEAVEGSEKVSDRGSSAASVNEDGLPRKRSDKAPGQPCSIDTSSFASGFARCMRHVCSCAPAPLNRLLGLQAVQALASHLAKVAEASEVSGACCAPHDREPRGDSTSTDGCKGNTDPSSHAYGSVGSCSDALSIMAAAREAAESVVTSAWRYLPPCFAGACSRSGVPPFSELSLERLLHGGESLAENGVKNVDGTQDCLLCQLAGTGAAPTSNHLYADRPKSRTALDVPLQTIAVCALVDAAMLTPGPASPRARLTAAAVILHLVHGLEMHPQVLEQALRCCRKRLKKGRICVAASSADARNGSSCMPSDLPVGLQLLWQAVSGAFCTAERREQVDDGKGEPVSRCAFSHSRIQSGFSSSVRAEALRLLALLAQMLIAASEHQDAEETRLHGQCVSKRGALAGFWPPPEDVAKAALELVRTYPNSAPVRKGFLVFGAALLSSSRLQHDIDSNGRNRCDTQGRQKFSAMAKAWTTCLVTCSSPEAEATIRRAAVQALAIVGLPVPGFQTLPSETLVRECCRSEDRAPASETERSSHCTTRCRRDMGACPDHTSSTSCEEALDIWEAMMTLLQDGEPVVRAEAIEACTKACSRLADFLVARTGKDEASAVSALSVSQAQQVVSILRSAICSQMPPRGVDSSVLMQIVLDVMVKLFPPYVVASKLWRSICAVAPPIRDLCATQLSIHLRPREGLGASRTLQQQEHEPKRTSSGRPLFDEEPANLYTEEVLIGQAAARNLLILSADYAVSSAFDARPSGCSSHTHMDSLVAMEVARSASQTVQWKGSVPFLLECRERSISWPGSVSQKADACSRRQRPPEVERQGSTVVGDQTSVDFTFLSNEVTKVLGELEDVCICLEEMTVQRLVWGDASFALITGSAAVPEYHMQELRTGDEGHTKVHRTNAHGKNQQVSLLQPSDDQPNDGTYNASGGLQGARTSFSDANKEWETVSLGNPHCTQQALFQPVYGALLKASLLLILLPTVVVRSASNEPGHGTSPRLSDSSVGAPATCNPCLHTSLGLLCRWVQRLDAKLRKTTETGSAAHWVLLAISHRLTELVNAIQPGLAIESADELTASRQNIRDGLDPYWTQATQRSPNESPQGVVNVENDSEDLELCTRGLRNVSAADRGCAEFNNRRPNAREAASSLVDTLLFMLPGLKRGPSELRHAAV
uniref:HEAT repeat-containing protein n=1 Tax=Toxoplasma gondii COUG TaxID=1074873 RepID=A0A2G8Y3L6_TOXGO|nr:HEAT repeat-containing protein [Toxoplasma gondii COUG]